MTETTTAHDLSLADVWPDIARVPRAPIKARLAEAIMRPAVQTTDVRITLPDGGVLGRGRPDAPQMVLQNPSAFYARLGADSKIGLGEAYMASDWTTGPDTDLADLLMPFAARLTTIVPRWLQRLRGIVDERLPHQERNTIEGSRSNIARHYDLSNEMFEQFLDETMTYSSAWFAQGDTLEQAQQRKLDGLLDDAGVGQGTRVLEIGSGWGSLAIRAAERGAEVLTVTISNEQAELARKRFVAAGVDHRIELRLQDYRDVTGEFDAIVSCEMIEAVGEEYWPAYFDKIDSLLAPGGKVAIQAILMADERYKATRNSYGWIQKYIFPGGLIPSPEAIDRTLRDHTTLHVTHSRSLGLHYAETLRQWRDRFNANWDSIQAQGFDDVFRRMWEFYLAYCEAGFAVGYLDVAQLQMSRR